jgi:hypothetical protein
MLMLGLNRSKKIRRRCVATQDTPAAVSFPCSWLLPCSCQRSMLHAGSRLLSALPSEYHCPC